MEGEYNMETYLLIQSIYNIFDVVGTIAGIIVLGYTAVELIQVLPQYIFKKEDGNEK